MAFVAVHLGDLRAVHVVPIGTTARRTALVLRLDDDCSVHLPGTGRAAITAARTLAAALSTAADDLELQLSTLRLAQHPDAQD